MLSRSRKVQYSFLNKSCSEKEASNSFRCSSSKVSAENDQTAWFKKLHVLGDEGPKLEQKRIKVVPGAQLKL